VGVALLAAFVAAGPASARDILRVKDVPRAFARAHAAAAVTWCGSGPAPADREPSVEVSSPNQVHVVYAVPSDVPDRFASLASAIATDVAAIDSWWQRQDPSRTPRFDLFPFPDCSARFGLLDLGYARLPHPTAYYYGAGGELRLGADLDVFAHSAKLKNLVFYDGSLEDPDICGSTDFLASNDGGRFGFAFVYLQSDCPNDTGEGEFTARVATHELLHNLGAEPAGGPPNACPNPENVGHPCDSVTDILFPYVTFGDTLDTSALDFGRDDYYGHSGWWWDVQDSAWLMHLPQFTLSIDVSGSGGATGTVAMTAPAQLSCSATCSESLDDGTRVTLVANPAKGAVFGGWSGTCNGAGVCTTSMDAAKSVVARFARATVRISVGRKGRGVVTSTPLGISCPGRCSASFTEGTVRLRAKAAKGYRFAGWSGDCRGKAACVLQAVADRTVTARFRKR
jgi:List-Bact-rpt repeat protein